MRHCIGSVTKTSNLANFYGGENLWPESGWKPSDGEKPEGKMRKSGSHGSGSGRGSSGGGGGGGGGGSNSSGSGGGRDLLASLAPEYAEIDSLGTFTSGKKGVDGDVSSAEAYASASVLAACNNRKNKVSEKFLSLPQCVPLLKGSSHNQHLLQQQQQQQEELHKRLSKDLLNNTDNEDKSCAESKRPFFIETSTPPLLGSSSLSFTSVGGGGGQRSALSSTLSGHQLSRQGGHIAASPYSVNPFTSQPHLLHKGVALTLRDLVPPPPPHPPPQGSHRHREFSRTNTLEELPYACYSSTRVASPRPLNGSQYGGSTNTYQSIEGLTESMPRECCAHACAHAHAHACSHAHAHAHHTRCGTCGSHNSSGSSCRRSSGRSSRCGHTRAARVAGGSLYSLSRPCCHDPARVSPLDPATALPAHHYRPNFYGWASPPGSPGVEEASRAGPRRQVSLESDALLRSEQQQVYAAGGSIRSDGEYWCSRDNTSVYGGSTRSAGGETVGGSRAGVQGTSPDSSAVEGAPSDAMSCGSCEETEASFYATCDKQTKL
ncbi:hypothetical protein Pmani_029668 [Petrolisthes manimaculis]|uniref:Uncharacterized protein n=1 Tax=Petrolisthes manimaculis TaxID=1843537 RepID=A0AAE1TU82_9EUCA|nr:hypothetical protein Pmani_029668 [Petrolisthes manimaculis]